jgi:murein DD-endopeptidase MepM/ murein hydrolase activator NlpD
VKNRLLITISDVSGTRHYNIHQLAKRVAAYIIGAICILAVVAALSINYLRHAWVKSRQEMEMLSAQAERTYLNLVERNQTLIDQNDLLATQLGEQDVALNTMTNRLEGLEHLALGDSATPDGDLLKRIELVSLSISEKKLMLSMIPSGLPIVKYRRISSLYGRRVHPVTKKQTKHLGIDFSANRGTPVYATADGIVEFVRKKYNQGYGNLVKIQHSLGFGTIYAHLDKVEVKLGQYVKKGTQIGLSGNSGMSSGPHLHYEVRFIGRALDPSPFTSWSLESFDDLFSKETSIPWRSLQNHVSQQVHLTNIPLSQTDAG